MLKLIISWYYISLYPNSIRINDTEKSQKGFVNKTIGNYWIKWKEVLVTTRRPYLNNKKNSQGIERKYTMTVCWLQHLCPGTYWESQNEKLYPAILSTLNSWQKQYYPFLWNGWMSMRLVWVVSPKSYRDGNLPGCQGKSKTQPQPIP